MTFSSLNKLLMTRDSLSMIVFFMISKNRRNDARSSRSSQDCMSEAVRHALGVGLTTNRRKFRHMVA